MNMPHESANLNGSATLYLMVGELRQGQKHLETGLRDLNGKVERIDSKLDRVVRRKPEPLAWIRSLEISPKQWLIVGLGIGMGATGTVTPELFRKLLGL